MFNKTLMDVGKALVAANTSGDIDALLEQHYSPSVVSVEAADGEGMPRTAEGLEALKAKHAWWNSTMEMHGGDVSGPFFFDPDRFAVRFTLDATNRETGERVQGEEIAVYTVADGKIVREEFFWAMG
jgi:ketosteroid isomerase-like protein